jgi:hypothetical protein
MQAALLAAAIMAPNSASDALVLQALIGVECQKML